MDQVLTPLSPPQSSVHAQQVSPTKTSIGLRQAGAIMVVIICLSMLVGEYVMYGRINKNLFAQDVDTNSPIAVISPKTTTPSISNSSTKYISQEFGFSFYYDSTQGIKIKEQKNKIYVLTNQDKPDDVQKISEGQYVEVLQKNPSDSFEEALKKLIPPQQNNLCKTVISKEDPMEGIIYYSEENIDLDSIKKHEASGTCSLYARTNGIRYIRYFPERPGVMYFFNIGQYPIMSGNQNKAWQETFELISLDITPSQTVIQK